MSCLKFFFFPSWWHVGIFHTCAQKSPWTVARSSTDTLSTLIAPWLLIVNKVNCRCFCLCEKHVTSSFNKIHRCLIGLRCGFICPLDGGIVSLEANSHIRINLFSNWIHWITDKGFIDLQWHISKERKSQPVTISTTAQQSLRKHSGQGSRVKMFPLSLFSVCNLTF